MISLAGLIVFSGVVVNREECQNILRTVLYCVTFFSIGRDEYLRLLKLIICFFHSMVTVSSLTVSIFMFSTCFSCTECDGKTYLKKACTKTEDTVCECISGYFYKSISSTCERCKDCSIGQGVLVACTHSTRRICRPCVEVQVFCLLGTTL